MRAIWFWRPWMALVKAVSASEGMASIGAGGVEDAAGGDVVAVIRAPEEVVTTAPAPGGTLVEGGTPGAAVLEEAMISDTRLLRLLALLLRR
jgi:hypothetical protein